VQKYSTATKRAPIKIQKQRTGSRLQLKDLKKSGLPTPTPHPWYQVHTMKTFNKRNKMHKYGLVYLNRGNDLYVAKGMSRMLPISMSTSL